MQYTQAQIDEVRVAFNIADPGELPAASTKDLSDPNRPGSFLSIPLWIRAAVPGVKLALSFIGITIELPKLPEIISRIQSSNLDVWIKSAVLAPLLFLQKHPEVFPVFE